MGRPSIFSDDIADEICTRLSAGETLRGICRDEHMPSGPTVRSWVLDDIGPGFSERYTRARQMGMEELADEIIEISDDRSNDTFVDPDTGAERPNSEWITRSRLRVDTRKFLMSKIVPKIYGDKIEHTGTIDVSYGARLASARDRLPAPEPDDVD